MTKLEQHRQTWQGKSDEWLFERIALELTQKVEEIHKLLAENEQLRIGAVMHWVAVEDAKPKDYESLIGIEMPYEERYACHREDNLYVSDETGESVVITHWIYAPEPPCA